ncbi:MAG TPA: hypothetical protein VFB96_06675 [Pirellulaceae bacterium]|nr:hypothetical protein [Pirellulaceae bacterium]
MSRNVRRHAISVSLFPFIAVLICIMGAFVVLLVMMVARVGTDAQSIMQAQASGSDSASSEAQVALEDARWRQEVLEKQREEKRQELADSRLALSHIEDHIRRLEDSARMLVSSIKKLDEGEPDSTQDLAPLQLQLKDLHGAISAKGQELADKQQQITSHRSYTLIPYEGRRGTRRMPLYVECVAEGVIIQPEGVLLTAADFDGPSGPGNPLDAALRAKREHLAKSASGAGGEPYPLLVVRPSGVMSYQAARAAMKAWEDEFGYELVSEDLNLDYGERSPQLDQALQSTVRDARRRQALLAASMPRKYQVAPTASSFDPPGDPGMEAEKSTAPGRGVGVGSGGMGVGRSDVYADGRAARAKPGADGTEAGAASAPQGSVPKPDAQSSSATPRIQHGGDPRQEGVKGGVPGAKHGKSLPAGAVAQQRGPNWGLPNAHGRPFAVTRPIRVVCLADRLVLLSDRRDSPRPQEFLLSETITAEEIDAFVSAIQKLVAGWGLAADNGYWKPALHVDVGSNAQERYEQLQAALQGSGIDVQRRR